MHASRWSFSSIPSSTDECGACAARDVALFQAGSPLLSPLTRFYLKSWTSKRQKTFPSQASVSSHFSLLQYRDDLAMCFVPASSTYLCQRKGSRREDIFVPRKVIQLKFLVFRVYEHLRCRVVLYKTRSLHITVGFSSLEVSALYRGMDCFECFLPHQKGLGEG